MNQPIMPSPEPVTICLRDMFYSPVTGHPPFKERVSWIRSELSQRGFAIEATVANCGVKIPQDVISFIDNDELRFITECNEKGIDVITTDYEIIFKQK